MTNKFLNQGSPIIFAVLISVLLIAWAVYEENNIQGSVFLPGGFIFQAYLPGRYAVYCDMDIFPEHEARRVANIKALPRVICEVRGAQHLNVLNVDVLHGGGISRYIKASDGTTRLLMPFAEFDILWPGSYEIRAAFNGKGPKKFLISLGPTGLVGLAMIFSIIVLLTAFFIMLRRVICKNAQKEQNLSTTVALEDLNNG